LVLYKCKEEQHTTKKRKGVTIMAKIKTTNKYINQVWGNVYRCGYCDLQYIMRGEDPVYYNCGVYGWNYDAYCDYKRNIAITTGYRNMTGRVIPNELINRYSEIAKDILKDYWNKPYEEVQKALAENRENFFEELINVC
jgi:hypothetical protein